MIFGDIYRAVKASVDTLGHVFPLLREVKQTLFSCLTWGVQQAWVRFGLLAPFALLVGNLLVGGWNLSLAALIGVGSQSAEWGTFMEGLGALNQPVSYALNLLENANYVFPVQEWMTFAAYVFAFRKSVLAFRMLKKFVPLMGG